MAAHHARYFKNGRMTKARDATKDIGRWKFIDSMIVGVGTLSSYVNFVQSHVGRMKAGWMAAAMRYGATGVPAWVARHGTGDGSFSEQFGKNGGYLEAVNTNKAIGAHNRSSRIVVNAIQSRTRDINAKLQRMMDRRAREWSRRSRMAFR
jgi:hypothetical protein